jgi:hypothetical protein
MYTDSSSYKMNATLLLSASLLFVDSCLPRPLLTAIGLRRAAPHPAIPHNAKVKDMFIIFEAHEMAGKCLCICDKKNQVKIHIGILYM